MYIIECVSCKIDISTEEPKEIYEFVSEHDHDDKMEHGKDTTYRELRCRCEKCRKANMLRQRKMVDSVRNKPVPPEKHGTLSGYNYWGCRCVLCKEQGSRENKRRRKERLESNGKE